MGTHTAFHAILAVANPWREYFVLLYLGPETIMPLASVIAAVLGFLLIFWRLIVNFLKKAIRIITRRGPEIPGTGPALIDTADETKDEVSSL